jgi:hypothetical protein
MLDAQFLDCGDSRSTLIATAHPETTQQVKDDHLAKCGAGTSQRHTERRFFHAVALASLRSFARGCRGKLVLHRDLQRRGAMLRAVFETVPGLLVVLGPGAGLDTRDLLLAKQVLYRGC